MKRIKTPEPRQKTYSEIQAEFWASMRDIGVQVVKDIEERKRIESGRDESREAISRFLAAWDSHHPQTPRQLAERRGLRVIEGGKAK